MSTKPGLFGDYPRVIYDRAPLAAVICQIRYPSLLKVDAAPPADFQEEIRHRFPLYEKGGAKVANEIPPELAKLLAPQLSKTDHIFKTEDEKSKVTLGAEAVSLTCESYSDWGAFRQDLELAVSALVKIYRPSFLSRIGLRYQNIIIRSEIGMTDVPWHELLEPHIAGELALPGWADAVEAFQNVIICELPDEGSFRLMHGYGNRADTDEQCYLIDFDFFTEAKTEVSNGLSKADRLHDQSRGAFRTCISDTLHDQLGPRVP